MKWFTYDQNNSGGMWKEPALTVFVQAPGRDEADAIVVKHDVYFDGCDSEMDCDCCGDRWSRAYDDGDDAQPQPRGGYGAERCAEEGVPVALYVHADGTTEMR